MKVTVDLQIAAREQPELPELKTLEDYVRTALQTAGYTEDAELTLRMTDEEEIRTLNRTYRQIDRPTNILSFPFECPQELSLPLLGDLVICEEILRREAQEQGKTYSEHLAHLIVHGTLHLIGYDHIEPEDAAVMEPLEIKALARLGYDDPYAEKA